MNLSRSKFLYVLIMHTTAFLYSNGSILCRQGLLQYFDAKCTFLLFHIRELNCRNHDRTVILVRIWVSMCTLQHLSTQTMLPTFSFVVTAKKIVQIWEIKTKVTCCVELLNVDIAGRWAIWKQHGFAHGYGQGTEEPTLLNWAVFITTNRTST